MQVRLLWEFRGPDAEQTAKHFEHHLREFFLKNHLEMPSGVAQAEGSLWTAFCDPPDLPRALVRSESERGPSGGNETPSEDEPTDSKSAQGAALESMADQVGRALRPHRVEIT